MSIPCVSIIVPIYNVSPYLRECIESIMNQSYTNLQVILVDDGSTDDSGAICDEYANRDSRIVVIHQKNRGLVAARKSGLIKATGEYIGFVDGDDYIDAGMYKELLDCILATNADIVHSGYCAEKRAENYKKTKLASGTIDRQEDKKKLIEDVLKLENEIEPSIWSKLFKRKIIMESYEDVEDDSSYGEDLICFLSSIMISRKISIIDKAFYHYRIRDNSLSHGVDYSAIQKDIQLYNNIKIVLLKHGMYEEYRTTLDYFAGMHVMRHMQNFCATPFLYETYSFREPELVQNKKIIVYGAGRVGRDFYSQFSRYTDCDVVAWVDKNADCINYSYINIQTPDVMNSIEYDLIIVAALEKMVADCMIDEMQQKGIDKNRIVWIEPEKIAKI